MSRKELLDPIGSICRLISLAFMPSGTKISIHSHILSLDKPDKLQFMYRMINGDTRDNISEIYDVIVRSIQWFMNDQEEVYFSDTEYPVIPIDSDDFSDNNSDKTQIYSDSNYMKVHNSKEIQKLLQYLVYSLKKMQTETYNNGNVILAIQFYINIINMSLEGMNIDRYLPDHLVCETLIDYNKLKNLWRIEELQYICDKYDECFNIINSDKHKYEENTEGRDIIINGIIKFVDDKLNKKNAEFQKLIKNSTS